MKKTILLFAAAMLIFCGCNAGTLQGSAAEEPYSTATPAAVEKALLIRESEEIETASIVFGGGSYALSRQEIAAISGLMEAVETVCVAEPAHLQGQFGDSMFTLEYVYADGSADTVYTTEAGSTFFRYTDTYGPDGDRGYVFAGSTELGEYLTGLCSSLLSPALSPDEIAWGEVSTGTGTVAEVVHIEDISQRAAAVIGSGALTPYKEGEFSSRMKSLTDGDAVTVTLFNAAGEPCAGFTEDELGVYLTVNSHPYRIQNESTVSAVSLLIKNAPQSVYFDCDDAREYVFSNGVALYMSYEEVISVMGRPDEVETHRPEQASCVYYGLIYGGETVLFMLSEGTLEESSLVCAQLFGRDMETARGTAPGDSRDAVFAAYGMEISENCGTLVFYYPDLYKGGEPALYDGAFAFSTRVRPESSQLMLFLFGGDTLTSILLRPAVALDPFPPLCASADSAEMREYWNNS